MRRTGLWRWEIERGGMRLPFPAGTAQSTPLPPPCGEGAREAWRGGKERVGCWGELGLGG